ncbi:hypothetical protein V1264_018911 [Littorina saxatilis]|uniref:Uncharacterized protein n=1 Tax=Littorina saxatilis TaxID=31220 RepID=A0AAN9GCN7_9CAEN
MADKERKKPQTRQMAAECSPSKDALKETGKVTTVSVHDPVSQTTMSVNISDPDSPVMPVLKEAKSKAPSAKKRRSGKDKTKDDFSSLFEKFSVNMNNMFAQQQQFAADLHATRKELHSLPAGVGGVASLAYAKAPPSCTITSADVHAEQGDCFIQGAVSRSSGLSSSPVARFSGESVQVGPELVAPPPRLGGESLTFPEAIALYKRRNSWGVNTGQQVGPELVAPPPRLGSESSTLPEAIALSKRNSRGVDTGQRDSCTHRQTGMSPVNVYKSQLPPSGQEAAFGQALHGPSVLQSASPVVDRFSDAASHSDFHGTATADSEVDDSHSLSEEEVDVKLSLRLKPAMVTAAQVSAKYFAEGVTAMTSSAAPPPSAVGDFRPALTEVQGYRFSESPSVAYELSKVLARTSGSENSLPVDTVPLLAAHGQAPDSAQPWLASGQLRMASTSFHARKFALSRRHHSLIETYALPSAPLPVTPELANLREDVYRFDKTCAYSEGALIGLEETGRYSLELASLSETLLRSLSRSIAVSLDPFEFRNDASVKDVPILLASLAKVSAEQMTVAARLYAHAVYTRRDAFLSGSRIQDKSTLDLLKVSPFTEGSLLGQPSLDALDKQTQNAKDLAIAKLAQHGFAKPQAKQQGPPKASFTSANRGRGSQHSQSSFRGRGRGAPYPKKKPSFGNARGSGRKPNLQ